MKKNAKLLLKNHLTSELHMLLVQCPKSVYINPIIQKCLIRTNLISSQLSALNICVTILCTSKPIISK